MRGLRFAALAALATACGPLPPDDADATVPASTAEAIQAARPMDRADRLASAEVPSALADEHGDDAAEASLCPEDMVHVDTKFCPAVQRRCLDLEHDPINHIDICHAFAHKQSCGGAEKRIAFCIDRYEYPNQKGAHPAWMIDWYQAQATCESQGKRLCWSSEWTAACEGRAHTPFPYGYQRNHDLCNMDNFFIEPKRPGPRAQFLFYSKNGAEARNELARLDQSVPSGSLEGCKSDFGVYDMPGNVDEWVISDEAPAEISKWAGLKGGAWGHVRSQCRPMTYSHDPGFQYYFVGFRCCRDAAGAPRWKPSPAAIPPPAVEPRDFAPDPVPPIEPPPAPKAKFSRTGKTE